MNDKLEMFRSILEEQQKAQALREGYSVSVQHGLYDCKVKIGRKYANVDVGTSGKYMVELSTGAIYGIKGYGVIHRGHYYGTLDTLNDYNWSGYTAHKLSHAA